MRLLDVINKDFTDFPLQKGLADLADEDSQW